MPGEATSTTLAAIKSTPLCTKPIFILTSRPLTRPQDKHFGCLLQDVSQLSPSFGPETGSRKSAVVPTPHSDSDSVCNIAAYLVVKIAQSLIDPEVPNYYHHLKLELGLLHQTLVLAGLAIQAYEYTPLGPNLTNIITQEAEQCCLVLQELLDTISTYRLGLKPTHIYCLWRRIFWSGIAMDGLATMRKTLLMVQKSLGTLLKALEW